MRGQRKQVRKLLNVKTLLNAGIWKLGILTIAAVLAVSFQALAVETENEIRSTGLLDYVETIYDESNGMITSEANGVLQDSQGYIWVGSYGGLSRYTGREFENMSRDRQGAPASGIRTLFQDSKERIWIGTNDSGLYLYENDTFSAVKELAEEGHLEENCPEIRFLSVRSIAETEDGLIYIGTTEGLFLVDQNFHMAPLWRKQLGNKTVESLVGGPAGTLWGITAEGFIFNLRNGIPEAIWGPETFPAKPGQGMCFGADGSLYMGTEENLVLRLSFEDPENLSGKPEFTPLSTGARETVNDIYQDRQGRMWICADNGVGYFDEEEVFYEIEGLSGDTMMTSMCEDYEGNLWFASSRRGLFELTRGKFINVSHEAGIQGQTTNSAVLYDEKLYIATDQGLAIMDENGKPYTNQLSEMLKGIRIRSLHKDSAGNLWIATYREHGLVRYRAESGEIRSFTVEQGMPKDQIRTVCELSDGRIAAATNGGVALIRGNEVEAVYGEQEGIENEVILCAAEGMPGILYAGSDGNGIYEIDLASGRVDNITTEDGLESEVILRIVPDYQEEGIWISNGAVLSFWNKDGIQPVNAALAGSGSIFDIKLTEDYIWLMKSFGTIRTTREALLEGREDFKVFSRKDGLTSSVTANSWNYLSKGGLLFLCTGNGVYFMDTNQIYKNETVPKIAVNVVSTDSEVFYGPQNIYLPPSNQRMTLNMDLLSFGFAGGELEYYLEGFDTEPVRVNARTHNQVSYTNLPGGDYVFHLKGYNADGVESRELTLPVHKEPSFFEQGYVYALMALGALLLAMTVVVLIQYMNKKRMLMRQQEYKNLTDQTIQIAAKTIDAKDTYTNGHSRRVAAYAMEIGRRYGMGEEQLEQLYYSALLHDIGKIGVPDHILNKKTRLTEEEFDAIKSHPAIGGNILEDFTLIPWISDGARYHHERYDGKGYNEGLKGDSIPLYARIISVADAYDAMNSTRIYRPAMTMEVIHEEIRRGAGTQFDPIFAGIMLDMIRDGYEAE